MPIRRFYVEADGSEIVDVGLRPALIYYGTSCYNLKVAAHNIIGEKPSENRVEVVVKGDQHSIDLFRDHVANHDIRAKTDTSMYKVSRLESYKGKEPDWEYCLSTVNAEQMFKGINAVSGLGGGITQMNESLKNIDTKFGMMIDRFGEFSKYMQQIVQSQVQ